MPLRAPATRRRSPLALPADRTSPGWRRRSHRLPGPSLIARLRPMLAHRAGQTLQPVGNPVIVALVRNEDVAGRPQGRRRIEGSGRDADRFALQPLPEQARAAAAAEAAACDVGGAVPLQLALAADDDVAQGGIRVGAVVPMELATLAAMAIDDVAQRAAHLVAHGAAQAAAGNGRSLLLGCGFADFLPSHAVASSPCPRCRARPAR